MLRKQHINPIQRVRSNQFLPLLRDEQPYYSNLNRPAKSAYNYADSVNTYLSYGGFVNVLQPGIDPAIHTFKLYEIVSITDDELIIPLDINSTDYLRLGIVVVEPEVDPISGIHSNIVICISSQNFVYPDLTVDSIWGDAPVNLYPCNDPASFYLTPVLNPALADGAIGTRPVARKTGAASIVFSGVAPVDSTANHTHDVIDGSLIVNGNLTVNGEIISSFSDRSLKDNITTIESPMDIVKALTGILYTPNDVAQKLFGCQSEFKSGLIAQDVEAVFPYVVSSVNHPSGDTYKTLQYERLIPVLVEAIKHQNSEIDQLKALVADLISRVA